MLLLAWARRTSRVPLAHARGFLRAPSLAKFAFGGWHMGGLARPMRRTPGRTIPAPDARHGRRGRPFGAEQRVSVGRLTRSEVDPHRARRAATAGRRGVGDLDPGHVVVPGASAHRPAGPGLLREAEDGLLLLEADGAVPRPQDAASILVQGSGRPCPHRHLRRDRPRVAYTNGSLRLAGGRHHRARRSRGYAPRFARGFLSADRVRPRLSRYRPQPDRRRSARGLTGLGSCPRPAGRILETRSCPQVDFHNNHYPPTTKALQSDRAASRSRSTATAT